jgi:hypothetical protein
MNPMNIFPFNPGIHSKVPDEMASPGHKLSKKPLEIRREMGIIVPSPVSRSGKQVEWFFPKGYGRAKYHKQYSQARE